MNHKSTYNGWYDIKLSNPMNNTYLTVCKQMVDGELLVLDCNIV